MMKGIIYKATNTLNGKVYIGATLRSLAQRKREHITAARAGGETAFYNAIRKYGEENFSWEEIYSSDSFTNYLSLAMEEIKKVESEFIKKYDSGNPRKGYNSDRGEGKTRARKKTFAVYDLNGVLQLGNITSLNECKEKFGQQFIRCDLNTRKATDVQVYASTKYIFSSFPKNQKAPKKVALVLTQKHCYKPMGEVSRCFVMKRNEKAMKEKARYVNFKGTK